MDLTGRQALRQVQLAEAELAILKQELALSRVLDNRELADDARAKLARLRAALAALSDAHRGEIAGGRRRIDNAA